MACVPADAGAPCARADAGASRKSSLANHSSISAQVIIPEITRRCFSIQQASAHHFKFRPDLQVQLQPLRPFCLHRLRSLFLEAQGATALPRLFNVSSPTPGIFEVRGVGWELGWRKKHEIMSKSAERLTRRSSSFATFVGVSKARSKVNAKASEVGSCSGAQSLNSRSTWKSNSNPA